MNWKERVQQVEQCIGYTFKNKLLLVSATTHISEYGNKHQDRDTGDSRERLEFLGDAVLELSLRNYVYRVYSDLPEGKLSEFCSVMRSNQHLADAAKKSGLALLCPGPVGSSPSTKMIADTVEAILGAVFLDRNFEAAARCVDRLVFPFFPERKVLERDAWRFLPKETLNKLCMKLFGALPTFVLLGSFSLRGSSRFVYGVLLGDILIGRGEGSRKASAEVQAALTALQNHPQLAAELSFEKAQEIKALSRRFSEEELLLPAYFAASEEIPCTE